MCWVAQQPNTYVRSQKDIKTSPYYTTEGAYWFSTAHPISRLPVFFMGVCAGVLCVRIQTGDLDALNRKT